MTGQPVLCSTSIPFFLYFSVSSKYMHIHITVLYDAMRCDDVLHMDNSLFRLLFTALCGAVGGVVLMGFILLTMTKV